MLFKHWGIIFLTLGAGLFYGGGLPSHGFKSLHKRYKEYKQLKKAGASLSLDHMDARNSYFFYMAGSVFILIGCCLLTIWYFTGK